MSGIPFIGRLRLNEYFALVISFTLVFLESVVRSITLLLPSPVFNFLYRLSRTTFNSLSSPYSRKARNRKKAIAGPIAQAEGFAELCELYGYTAEEHVVQTKDGYLLGVHRLAWRKGEEMEQVNAGPGSVQKKVVYLHHGLLMNSDVWVCITDHERCLPFKLVDQGYDVWLGNNRGNKYSKKNLHHSPTSIPFWNFSIDQFAFHDIPDTIHYILNTTHQPSLSYIGFSQGTAQAFAALSIYPTLNAKVDVFIALAPAMSPPGLAKSLVSSLIKANPEFLFLIFGRRAILGSAPMWQALLYPGIFTWCVDKGLVFLFNWKTLNIAPHQKLAAYPHLYSFTSVKSVVHWFQIIRNSTFQMYDDEVTSPVSFSTGSNYYKVAKFPTRNIRTPIVLLYGGCDSLVDINVMLNELPRHTVAKCIPKYEHLDFLWASDVHKLVIPHVLEALESYGLPAGTKQQALEWRPTSDFSAISNSSVSGSQPPGYSEDERSRTRRVYRRSQTDTEIRARQQMDESDDEEDDDEDDAPDSLSLLPSAFAHSSRVPPASSISTSGHDNSSAKVGAARTPHSQTIPLTSASERKPTRARANSPGLESSPATTVRGHAAGDEDWPEHRATMQRPPQSPLASMSNVTDQTITNRRPEGWWSSTNSSVSLAVIPSPADERNRLFE